MIDIVSHPLFATVAGWLAWNVWHFSADKDIYDAQHKAFPFKEYFRYSWDNWVKSLVFIPVLLFVGAITLDLDPLVDQSESVAWSDLYYLGAGFIPEWLYVRYKRWKGKNLVP